MIFATWILLWILQIVTSKLVEIQNKNEFKKVLKSHSNILVAFADNDRVDVNLMSMLSDVAAKGNELAKVLTINCQVNKKLCKKYKVNPKAPVTVLHFHKGKFNKIYDRKLRPESMLRFLEDPTGDIAWEEDDSAKDVVHVKGSQELQKIVAKFKDHIPPLMLMFYAPWCGYCKQMKPEFAAAASMTKGKSIFIGINGDLPSTDDLKQAFNITGYPSVFLIQDGNKVFKYENDNSRDALVEFVHNPSKPAPPKDLSWAEETNEIDFLTDAGFHEYINQYESVLVMFYAPWCGHCKSMKPEMVDAAKQLRQLKVNGRIAAVDSTEHKNVSESLHIKGFPTLKYFKNGEYMFDVNERSSAGIVRFMTNPQKPPEPVVEVPWKEENSFVLHPSSDEFRSILKRSKHVLVMFYAPWCGHCKATKPKFTSAANRMQDNSKVAFVAVDCTEQSYSTICTSEGINGFPTIRYFNYGKNTSHSEYSLTREEDDFVAFMTNPAHPKLDARRHWRLIPGHEAVALLESDTFVDNVMSRKSGALVMFYSPYCTHCMAMQPAYVSAAIRLQQSLPSCLLAAVDATSETLLAAQYRVTGFPTLIYFAPDGKWHKYNGDRKDDDFVDFMIKKDNDLKQAEQRHKEDVLKKQAEREKKMKEETERRLAQEQKIKEEKERQSAEEKRIKEEIERKLAEEKRIKEENEKKIAEEKRIKEEKEIEEKKIKEETEKKLAKEKMIKEENEKKRAEEKRIKDEAEKKLSKEKKLKEEKEKKSAEEKRIKEETEKKIAEEKRIREEERRKSAEAKEVKEERTSVDGGKQSAIDEVQMIALTELDQFKERMALPALSVVYCHKANRKATVRTKLAKLLKKFPSKTFAAFEVDCVHAVALCDELGLVDVPLVLVYSSGRQLGSLSGSWGEDSFKALLATEHHHSSRDGEL